MAADEPALRPVPPENLHVTLVFLGYQAERRTERIASALTEALSGRSAPRMQLSPEPVGKPPRRPRIVVARLQAEGLDEIAEEVSRSLRRARLYRPEKRPFWGHLTLARIRAEERGSRRPARLEGELPALPRRAQEPFDAVRVALYRSNLRPQGAEYVSLARFELPTTRPDQR